MNNSVLLVRIVSCRTQEKSPRRSHPTNHSTLTLIKHAAFQAFWCMCFPGYRACIGNETFEGNFTGAKFVKLIEFPSERLPRPITESFSSKGQFLIASSSRRNRYFDWPNRSSGRLNPCLAPRNRNLYLAPRFFVAGSGVFVDGIAV